MDKIDESFFHFEVEGNVLIRDQPAFFRTLSANMKDSMANFDTVILRNQTARPRHETRSSDVFLRFEDHRPLLLRKKSAHCHIQVERLPFVKAKALLMSISWFLSKIDVPQIVVEPWVSHHQGLT